MRMNGRHFLFEKFSDPVVELGFGFLRDGGVWVKRELELVKQRRQFR